MVEFTEEEQAKYRERLRLRAELAARQRKEEPKEITTIAPAPPRTHGILERVANKTEDMRTRYDNMKTQGGRIKNAISPPKNKQSPVRHAYAGISNRRHAHKLPIRSQPFDSVNYHITGPKNTKRDATHMDNMIGMGSGDKASPDFMNEMIHGKSSGKKKKDDFWREMLGH